MAKKSDENKKSLMSTTEAGHRGAKKTTETNGKVSTKNNQSGSNQNRTNEE